MDNQDQEGSSDRSKVNMHEDHDPAKASIAKRRVDGRIMKRSMIALGCILIAGPALAQSVSEKTGVNSALGISPTMADFIKEAANSDMLEIAVAKLALDNGNAEEKKFAEQMMADHGKTSSDLRALVSSGAVKADIPTALDSSSQKKLDKLRDTRRQAFASEFDPMQVSAHKEAVALFERYSKSGDNPILKDWASKTLPTLQHHLDMAEALNKSRK
jgi:putative membrane protein